MPFRAVVVDTNVVVAGLLTRESGSPTARVLDWMLTGRIPFLVSPPLLAEYRDVLLRQRIRSRHGLNEDEVDRVLSTLATNAIVREPDRQGAMSPSPADQHLWDLLACEPESILLTGDKLLLTAPPSSANVVSAAEFVSSWAT